MPSGRRSPPERAPQGPRRARSDLLARVLVAVPAAVIAIAFVNVGGLAWALFMLAIALVCLHELYRMLPRWRPAPIVGFVSAAAMIIAETEAPLKTITVSMAVMELDLTGGQTIVFRNAAHGGLSVVYRRPDGNFGWIDPERTTSALEAEGRD